MRNVTTGGPCDNRGKPEAPLACHEEPLPSGYRSYSVLQEMTMPDGAHHVRGCAIYLPRMTGVPSVSVRIVSHEGSALLHVTSLKINDDVGGWLQIAVAAQSLPPGAHPATGVHYCNLVVIGKPKPQPKMRAASASRKNTGKAKGAKKKRR
jgi:hypothetical protein